MFLQGHLYQASLPQVKFQMPAPNANKQCILMNNQKHVYFITPNDFGLIQPGLITISCNIHVRKWLIFCSEIAFVILENFRETIFFFSNTKFSVFFKVWGNLSKNLAVLFCDGTWYAWTFSLPSHVTKYVHGEIKKRF